MISTRRILRLICAVAAVTVVAVPPVAGGEDALLEADREFARVTAEKGLEGFASMLAEDLWMLLDGRPVIKGKAGAVEAWRPLLSDPNTSISWEPVLAVLAESGELGYTVGNYEIRGTDAEGKRFVQRGKYVTIWRKQAGGAWKVVLDGGNTDGPPETPAD